jgi:hypothetical protein
MKILISKEILEVIISSASDLQRILNGSFSGLAPIAYQTFSQ